MRKIPKNLENPFDNIIIDLCDRSSTYFKQLNLTPNMLTTFSLIISLISAIYLYYDWNITAAVLFVVAYFFDCADGFYARKYKMETEFGDYYDHFADWSKIILVLLILYLKSSSMMFPIMILTILFLIPISIQMGCQEKIYENENNVKQPILDTTKKYCSGDPKRIMSFVRYFGCGTYIMIVAILLLCS